MGDAAVLFRTVRRARSNEGLHSTVSYVVEHTETVAEVKRNLLGAQFSGCATSDGGGLPRALAATTNRQQRCRNSRRTEAECPCQQRFQARRTRYTEQSSRAPSTRLRGGKRNRRAQPLCETARTSRRWQRLLVCRTTCNGQLEPRGARPSAGGLHGKLRRPSGDCGLRRPISPS